VCYHTVQNILSSHILPGSTKITIHKNITSSVVLCGHETWTTTLMEKQTLDASEYGA
jgi:hypothetical protein